MFKLRTYIHAFMMISYGAWLGNPFNQPAQGPVTELLEKHGLLDMVGVYLMILGTFSVYMLSKDCLKSPVFAIFMGWTSLLGIAVYTGAATMWIFLGLMLLAMSKYLELRNGEPQAVGSSKK